MVVRRMKEKCKDAARMRREKERAEFIELAKLLPLPSSTTSQLDKASIIRLTSSYLKLRTAFPEGLGETWGCKEQSSRHAAAAAIGKTNITSTTHQTLRGAIADNLNDNFHVNQHLTTKHHQQQQPIRELGSLLLQTLDGFVFALHKDGKIMYISETASVHLGLPQIDLTGSSIFEYIHPSDHNDIYKIINLNEEDKLELEAKSRDKINSVSSFELSRSFCVRMKCILPKRNAGLVNSGYKAIHCNGYVKVRRINLNNNLNLTSPITSSSNQHQQQEFDWESYALIAVGHSLLPTASTEIKLTNHSFMFRASLDLKLYYVEASVSKLLGYEQAEMFNQSLYKFLHLNDLVNMEAAHRLLMDKGQVVTRYYRLMKKHGGFAWLQSYATLISNPRNMPRPQHIVCICIILGEDQFDGSCLLQEQMQNSADDELAQRHSSANNAASVVSHGINSTSQKFDETNQHSRSSQSMAITELKQSDKSTFEKTPAQQQTKRGRQQHGPANSNPKRARHKVKQDNLIEREQILKTFDSDRCQCWPMVANGFAASSIQIPLPDSIRRTSVDSCSVISSVASTSVSSTSSCAKYLQAPNISSEYLNQTIGEAGYNISNNLPDRGADQMYHPHLLDESHNFDYNNYQMDHQLYDGKSSANNIQQQQQAYSPPRQQLWFLNNNSRSNGIVFDEQVSSYRSTSNYVASIPAPTDWSLQSSVGFFDQKQSEQQFNLNTNEVVRNNYRDLTVSYHHERSAQLAGNVTNFNYQPIAINNGCNSMSGL